MAEELYFIKLDAEKAKTKLIQYFNIENKISYKEHLDKDYDENLDFQKIVRKIENNIELLSREEFWSLYSWFYKIIELQGPNLDYNEQWESFINAMSS